MSFQQIQDPRPWGGGGEPTVPRSADIPALLPGGGRGDYRSESRNQNQTTGHKSGEACLPAPLWAGRPLPRGREAAGAPARGSRGLAGPWAQDACSLPGDRSKVPPALGAALGASLSSALSLTAAASRSSPPALFFSALCSGV